MATNVASEPRRLLGKAASAPEPWRFANAASAPEPRRDPPTGALKARVSVEIDPRLTLDIDIFLCVFLNCFYKVDWPKLRLSDVIARFRMHHSSKFKVFTGVKAWVHLVAIHSTNVYMYHAYQLKRRTFDWLVKATN